MREYHVAWYSHEEGRGRREIVKGCDLEHKPETLNRNMLAVEAVSERPLGLQPDTDVVVIALNERGRIHSTSWWRTQQGPVAPIYAIPQDRYGRPTSGSSGTATQSTAGTQTCAGGCG